MTARRSRLGRAFALAASGAALALVAGGCGGQIKTQNTADHNAAVSFNQHCSGCHSLNAANAYGSRSGSKLKKPERTDGPNFNQRKVKKADALFAIRNGGFSGAIMPANIVTGKEADELAAFVAKYSHKSQ